MKKTYALITLLVAAICLLSVALVFALRPRTNVVTEHIATDAPERDLTGVLRTGQTVTVKVTGDAPNATLVFGRYKTGTTAPKPSLKEILLPYETVFISLGSIPRSLLRRNLAALRPQGIR